MNSIYTQQTDNIDTGQLKININSAANYNPIQNATIEISFTGEPTNILESVSTDISGQTEAIDLKAPPLELSLAPQNIQPYSEYNLKITANGFNEIVISGVEILPTITAIQNVLLKPIEVPEISENQIVIPDHTLYGEYPPKIPEDEIKPIEETGEIVLRNVVVPEFVVVHDGPPTDTTARDYYVRYKDYIKNVASSEIYATWPESTIRANVFAIMSFTMNRVFTEWYRNKGFNFTITSSTAFDQKFMPGRNIFDTISSIVDDIFTNFISRPNVKQPILTQYCDGYRVTCSNWLSQWGSKDLGEQNYTPIDILRHYYGSDVYINSTEQVAGVPISWPRTTLQLGSSGDNVRHIQEQINAIAKSYPAIPTLSTDGIYGLQTKAAVEKFQSVFGLPVNGIVDYRTWYKISEIYVAVTRMAELQ